MPYIFPRVRPGPGKSETVEFVLNESKDSDEEPAPEDGWYWSSSLSKVSDSKLLREGLPLLLSGIPRLMMYNERRIGLWVRHARCELHAVTTASVAYASVDGLVSGG